MGAKNRQTDTMTAASRWSRNRMIPSRPIAANSTLEAVVKMSSERRRY